jgi:hypothetical protein
MLRRPLFEGEGRLFGSKCLSNVPTSGNSFPVPNDRGAAQADGKFCRVAPKNGAGSACNSLEARLEFGQVSWFIAWGLKHSTEGRAQSRRDGPIVAWHEVPGTADPPQKNRPVGYGMIGRRANPRDLSSKGPAVFLLRKANHSDRRIGPRASANQTVPYGTALLRSRCPRHFVPGYDRTDPPGLEGDTCMGPPEERRMINEVSSVSASAASPGFSSRFKSACMASAPIW